MKNVVTRLTLQDYPIIKWVLRLILIGILWTVCSYITERYNPNPELGYKILAWIFFAMHMTSTFYSIDKKTEQARNSEIEFKEKGLSERDKLINELNRNKQKRNSEANEPLILLAIGFFLLFVIVVMFWDHLHFNK